MRVFARRAVGNSKHRVVRDRELRELPPVALSDPTPPIMPTMDEYVTTTTIDGVAVITGEGDLDAFSAGQLRAAVIDACRASEVRVVIDLTKVPFMDSTALGVLVGGVRRVSDAGGQLAIVLPLGAARRVFEITTLDRILPLADSRRDAIQMLT
jgi:anti-sigma B factor antagonist